MREILFRGKRLDNGEWVEGLLWRKHYKGNSFICYFPDEDDNEEAVRVDPATVCQYTGLTDKNGVKIFEGDVVVLDKDVKETFNVKDGEVKYARGGFFVDKFSSLNSLNVLATYYGVLRGEVVGNIFDNPELMEGGVTDENSSM